MVLIMSVNPGYGGQSFIPNTYTKIEKLNELIQQKGSKAKIEVDGGVDLNNANKLFETGANILVAGNSVFSSTEPTKTISQLKQL